MGVSFTAAMPPFGAAYVAVASVWFVCLATSQQAGIALGDVGILAAGSAQLLQPAAALAGLGSAGGAGAGAAGREPRNASQEDALGRAQAHTVRGEQLANKDQPSYSPREALAEFSAALELAPGYLPALTGAASAASMAGQLGAAERFWARAAGAAKGLAVLDGETPPAVGILSALAVVQLLSGKWVDAIESYQDLLTIRLTSVEAWVGIGICFRESGRPDEALVGFQRAISRDQDGAAAAFEELLPSVNAGKLWVQRTRDGAGKPIPEAEWLGLAGKADEFRQLGKLEEAAIAYRRLLGMASDAGEAAQSDAWNQLGLTLLALLAMGEQPIMAGTSSAKMLAGGKNAFANAVARRPFHADSWVNYAQAVKNTFSGGDQELQTVLSVLRTALLLVPQHPRALYIGATMLELAGEVDRSAKLYQQLLLPTVATENGFQRQVPKDPPAEPKLLADGWVSFGLLLGKQTAAADSFTKSLKCFQNAIELEPRASSRAYHHLGQAYQSVGMLDLAVGSYALALQVSHGL